jgi:hypothetical protein
VLGFTKTKASCQPGHARDRHTQPSTALQYGELMPQGEDLEVQGDPGAEHGDQSNDQCDEDGSHGGHSSRVAAAAQRCRQRPFCSCRRLARASRG